MALTRPKYALIEHERRFIVAPARLPALDPATVVLIEDRYLDGSRLRLRRTTAADGTVICKLAKKYAGATPVSRPMTNLYLDPAEFAVLRHLPGRALRKCRYRVAGGFVVDVFDDALAGLNLAEIEAALATVEAAPMPDWSDLEVTADPHYDGATLSSWTPADLAAHCARFG